MLPKNAPMKAERLLSVKCWPALAMIVYTTGMAEENRESGQTFILGFDYANVSGDLYLFNIKTLRNIFASRDRINFMPRAH